MKTENDDSIISQYTTKSTSPLSAEVNRIVLYESSNTRKVLESNIVRKSKGLKANLHITIIHEKKGAEGWVTDKITKLSTLKKGSLVSCDLDSDTTSVLFDELSKLYAIAENVGVENFKNNYCVVKINQGTKLSPSDENTISQILNYCSDSPGFAKKLAEISPELISKAHEYQVIQQRKDALACFKLMLEREQCLEQEWQDFFKKHNWILGGVHNIQYLSEVADQPIFSGANVQGKGEKRGDFLACTGGNARFTAIVEIKKANTNLLKVSYRRDVYCPSDDLNGGVAQLRAYLRKWQIEGSRTEENRDLLESAGIYTVQPMGILIVGNLKEVKEDRKKREAFELFRQNQKDVYIITFDEVFSRAQELLALDKE